MTSVAESLGNQTATPPLLQNVDQLLRDSQGVLRRIQEGKDLAILAKAMILTVAVGAGVFGASMGTFRGGLQIPYAAIKLPLVFLLTLAICAPALSALNHALGRPFDLRRDVALVLVAIARTSLLLAAEAPLVLLAVRLKMSYHAVVLLVVLCCAIAGMSGIVLFVRGLYGVGTKGLATVALGLLGVFCLVGTQMSWTLRPYLLRPRTPEVVFVRAIESSFFEAVFISTRSWQGVYDREYAPLPGEGEYWEESQ